MKSRGSGTNGHRRLDAGAKDGDGKTFVRLRRFARWLRYLGGGLHSWTRTLIADILITPQLVEVVTWNQLGIHMKRKLRHSSPLRSFNDECRSDRRAQHSGVLQPPPATHPQRDRRRARPGRK
jgi:hypothetical protein